MTQRRPESFHRNLCVVEGKVSSERKASGYTALRYPCKEISTSRCPSQDAEPTSGLDCTTLPHQHIQYHLPSKPLPTPSPTTKALLSAYGTYTAQKRALKLSYFCIRTTTQFRIVIHNVTSQLPSIHHPKKSATALSPSAKHAQHRSIPFSTSLPFSSCTTTPSPIAPSYLLPLTSKPSQLRPHPLSYTLVANPDDKATATANPSAHDRTSPSRACRNTMQQQHTR